MEITLKSFMNEIHYKVNITLRLLYEFKTGTESILLIDLLKRMIEKIPNHRETYNTLIDHAFFKSNQDRLKIVRDVAKKCFDENNDYLIKTMNKNEVHMEGSLGEETTECKKFLDEISKLPGDPDIKQCSSLLKIIAFQVVICFWMLTRHPSLFYCIFRKTTVYSN